jgi:Kef-type K+ transport system membrane component KefB
MMPDVSLSGLVIVAAVAFAVPLFLGFAPVLRLPRVVVEILAGVVIGPWGLGWVQVDLPTQVLSLIGLAFLLLLAGLEVDFERLLGPLLKLTGFGFLLSFGLAVAVGYSLGAVGLVQTPPFIAIVLAATSLGVLIPLLKDTGRSGSDFGQVVIAAASLADFGTIILLSVLFSREATSIWTQLVLIGSLVLLAVLVFVAVRGAEHSTRLSMLLLQLQDTTAQIRVRGAFVLLAIFVALAQRLGLEVILGAFIAGVVLGLVDRDERMTHARFRPKLEAVGFGVFIPFFFVVSGLRFNLGALFASPWAAAQVPIFLLALLLVRGLPAALYRTLLGNRRAIAAGLLQATTLGFVVVAAQIGVELRLVSEATGAALVAAGLVSVLLFPLAALIILRAEPVGESAAAGQSGPDTGEAVTALAAGGLESGGMP